MKLDHYQLEADNVFMAFQFVSEGPKGRIMKEIQYVEMETKNTYNLAFGDKTMLNGDIDDTVISNNKDAQKVLATVAKSVLMFTEQYPEAFIFAEGSSESRTRWYRMVIANNFDEISTIFNVFGIIGNKVLKFERNVSFDSFVFKRK